MIDFSEARLLDPDWWRRTTILVNEVGHDDDEKTLRDVYNFHLALVGNSGLTEESFNKEQERARTVFSDIVGVLRPWEGTNASERKDKEIQDLRQDYVAAFGDPKDPVIAAKLAAGIKRMMQTREEQLAKEDDMSRITRLQMERKVKLERLARLKKQGRKR